MAVPDVEQREPVRADWGPTARIAGAVAGVGIAVQTVLFFLDLVVLPVNPPFTETGAGRDRDLAAFFVAYFERQHDVLWNIALRDTIGPVAGIALIVLVRALVAVRARGSAAAQAWALVVVVGALLKALADLVYLSLLGWWQGTDFVADPPADIIAAARAAEAVDHLSRYLGPAGYLALAVGMLGLAPLLSGRLPLLARTLAVGLVVSIGTELGGWVPVYEVGALLTGVLVAPVLLIGLGRSIAAAAANDGGAPTVRPEPRSWGE